MENYKELINTNKRNEKYFQFDRIFSIQRTLRGFQFVEECDYYHSKTVSKAEAIQILNTALAYIKSDNFGVIPDFKDL